MTDTPADNEAVERLKAYAALRENHIRRPSDMADHIHGFGTCDCETALYLSDIRALLAAEAERDAALQSVKAAYFFINHPAKAGRVNATYFAASAENIAAMLRETCATLDQPKEGNT